METATKTYSMTCTCGDKIRVDASSREEAIEKLKEGMDELATANHVAERHLGDDAPSVEEMHEIIEVTTAQE